MTLFLRLASQGRIEKGGRNAQFVQCADLVLHQRNQRRDDQRRTVAQQRGYLVAQRLAAAGGHQHQRIAAGQHRVDGGALLTAKLVVAEDSAQEIAGGVSHRGRITKLTAGVMRENRPLGRISAPSPAQRQQADQQDDKAQGDPGWNRDGGHGGVLDRDAGQRPGDNQQVDDVPSQPGHDQAE